MRRARLCLSSAFPALLALAGLLGACGNATGSPSGGADLFDASPAPAPDTGATPTTEDAGSGITWTDLYRDFFGRPAPGPGCKGTGACHGSAGVGGGGTWVCGDTKESCWQGITAVSAGLLDTKAPENSALLLTIRTKDGGSMPKNPRYVFSDESVKRIRDWMAAGAQNN